MSNNILITDYPLLDRVKYASFDSGKTMIVKNRFDGLDLILELHLDGFKEIIGKEVEREDSELLARLIMEAIYSIKIREPQSKPSGE